MDIGRNARRRHVWPFSDNDLEFKDIIVVSDEVPPPAWEDGKSYTLWTLAHQQNSLAVDGNRCMCLTHSPISFSLTFLVVEVHQIPFVWELAMSTKLDAQSNVIGSYGTDDLSLFMYPEEKKKGKRRVKMRRLEYELVWNITEM